MQRQIIQTSFKFLAPHPLLEAKFPSKLIMNVNRSFLLGFRYVLQFLLQMSSVFSVNISPANADSKFDHAGEPPFLEIANKIS